jgi:hypothetical protein
LADNGLYLQVSAAASGSVITTTTAVSSTNALLADYNTTYVLAVIAKITGPGSGDMSLLLDDNAVAGVGIESTGINVGAATYTTTLRIGGIEDSAKVGLGIKSRFRVGAGPPMGGANGTFTNIMLTAYGPRPQLSLRPQSQSQLQLAWPAFYTDYVLEQTANLSLWTAAPNQVTTNGTELIATVDINGGSQLFRLRKQHVLSIMDKRVT